jgi:hypothetical protein
MARRLGRSALASRSMLVMLAVLVAGCSSLQERTPVPEPLMDGATVPDLPFNARFWGDTLPPWMDDMQAQARKVASGPNRPSAWDEPQRYLAISGGGPDGAFGAGLLNGWTAAGDRPAFTIVTGISTGALTAPFAFLGPDYDPVLEEIYTTYSTEDLVEQRTWLGIVTGDSAADTAPLFALIERYLDDEAIAKIAAANADGRRLFIGTTNLDAGRPMLWNITAIAASDAPEKARLIHEILLASASIPPKASATKSCTSRAVPPRKCFSTRRRSIFAKCSALLAPPTPPRAPT